MSKVGGRFSVWGNVYKGMEREEQEVDDKERRDREREQGRRQRTRIAKLGGKGKTRES